MTLPEFLAAAARSAAIDDGTGDIRSWVRSLTAERTATAYLREPVAQIADPTGSTTPAFESAVVAIEQQCCEVVGWLSVRAHSTA